MLLLTKFVVTIYAILVAHKTFNFGCIILLAYYLSYRYLLYDKFQELKVFYQSVRNRAVKLLDNLIC